MTPDQARKKLEGHLRLNIDDNHGFYSITLPINDEVVTNKYTFIELLKIAYGLRSTG